jgi:hypothetical protein
MPHDRSMLEDLIVRAEKIVAEGEDRLAAQRARIAELKRIGGGAGQSTKFLRIMEDTQALQIDHLRTLKQELETGR